MRSVTPRVQDTRELWQKILAVCGPKTLKSVFDTGELYFADFTTKKLPQLNSKGLDEFSNTIPQATDPPLPLTKRSQCDLNPPTQQITVVTVAVSPIPVGSPSPDYEPQSCLQIFGGCIHSLLRCRLHRGSSYLHY